MKLNFLIIWRELVLKKDHLRIKFFWRNMLCFDIKRLNAWLASLTTVLTACEGFKTPPLFFKSRKFDDSGSLWFKKFRQSPHFSFDFICFCTYPAMYVRISREYSFELQSILFKYRFIHSESSCVEQFPNLVLFVAPNIIFL